MAYEQWMPEFQEVWENLPIDEGDLTQQELDYAEFLFEEGFMRYTGESPSADITFARDEFFGFLGLEEENFDWHGWRVAMGYEDE